MPTTKPVLIPRGKDKPPAATFEPEKWTKTTWKGKSRYDFSPPKKEKGLVEALGELVPKKYGGKREGRLW